MTLHAGWTKTRSFLESGVIRLPILMGTSVGMAAFGEVAYRTLRTALQTITMAWGNNTPVDQNPLFVTIGKKAPDAVYTILESIRPFRNNDLQSLAWKVGIGVVCGAVLWDLFDRVSQAPTSLYRLGLKVTPFTMAPRKDLLMAYWLGSAPEEKPAPAK